MKMHRLETQHFIISPYPMKGLFCRRRPCSPGMLLARLKKVGVTVASSRIDPVFVLLFSESFIFLLLKVSTVQYPCSLIKNTYSITSQNSQHCKVDLASVL